MAIPSPLSHAQIGDRYGWVPPSAPSCKDSGAHYEPTRRRRHEIAPSPTTSLAGEMSGPPSVAQPLRRTGRTRGLDGRKPIILPSSEYLALVCSRHLPLAAKAPIPASGKGASRRSKSRRSPSRATLGAMQQVQHIVFGPGIRPAKSRAPGSVRGNRQCAPLPRYLVIGSRMRAANVERRQDVQPVIPARKTAAAGAGAPRRNPAAI
jgi:hypothetical protein